MPHVLLALGLVLGQIQPGHAQVSSPRVSLVADTRVVSIEGGRAEITATLESSGNPSSYRGLIYNGTELFPDNGELSAEEIEFDEAGKATFIYRPDNLEDLVDISVIVLAADQEIGAGTNLADLPNARLQLVKDDPAKNTNLGLEKIIAQYLGEDSKLRIDSKLESGEEITLEDVDANGNSVQDNFEANISPFDPATDLEVLVSLNRELTIDQLQEFNLDVVTDDVVAGTISKSQLLSLSQLPQVTIVEEDQATSGAQVDEDSDSGDGDLTGSGSSVGVAVLDSGLDTNYGLIDSSRVRGWYDALSGRSTSYDDEKKFGQHGTKVAGVVLQSSARATVTPVKVLDANNAGESSDLVEGLQWVANNASEFNVKAVNLSLVTYDYSYTVGQLVNQILNQGVAVVAAAGNDSGPVNYPARYQGVVSVGATDAATNQLADFSSRGPGLDVAAPGANLSFTKDGQTYSIGSGTSFASPSIAAKAAELVAAGADPKNLVGDLQEEGFTLPSGAVDSGGSSQTGDNSAPGSSQGQSGLQARISSQSLTSSIPSFEIVAEARRNPDVRGTLQLVYDVSGPATINGRSKYTELVQGSYYPAKQKVNIDPGAAGTNNITVSVELWETNKPDNSDPQQIASAPLSLTYEGAASEGGDPDIRITLNVGDYTIEGDSTNPIDLNGKVNFVGGRGGANASVEFETEPSDAGTIESVQTDQTGFFRTEFTPSPGDRNIVITAYATTEGGSTASTSKNITQGDPENPSSDEEGEGDESSESQARKGPIQIEVRNTAQDSTGYTFEVQTGFEGDLVDVTLTVPLDELYGSIAGPDRKSTGLYEVKYTPSSEARQRNLPAILRFSAVYRAEDGSTKSSSMDYALDLSTTDTGNSTDHRGLSISASPTNPTNPGDLSIRTGGKGFCTTTADAERARTAGSKAYVALRARLTDGNGTPLVKYPVAFGVKASSAGFGERTVGYLAQESFSPDGDTGHRGCFYPATGTKVRGETDGNGYVDAYWAPGQWTKGTITLEATSDSLAQINAATVDINVQEKCNSGGRCGSGDGGNSGDGGDSDSGADDDDQKEEEKNEDGISLSVSPLNIDIELTPRQEDPSSARVSVNMVNGSDMKITESYLSIEVKSGDLHVDPGNVRNNAGKEIRQKKILNPGQESDYGFVVYPASSITESFTGTVEVDFTGHTDNGKPFRLTKTITVNIKQSGGENTPSLDEIADQLIAAVEVSRSGDFGQRNFSIGSNHEEVLSKSGSDVSILVQLRSKSKGDSIYYEIDGGGRRNSFEFDLSLERDPSHSILVVGNGTIAWEKYVVVTSPGDQDFTVNRVERRKELAYFFDSDSSKDLSGDGEGVGEGDGTLSNLDINQVLEKLSSDLTSSSLISNADKAKIREQIQRAKQNPADWEKAFGEINGIINSSTRGRSNDPAAKDLYKKLGEAGLDMLNQQIRNDDNKSDADKLEFDKLVQSAKNGNRDALVDMRNKLNLTYYPGFSRVMNLLERAGLDTRNYSNNQSNAGTSNNSSGNGSTAGGVGNSILSFLFSDPTSFSGAQADTAEGPAQPVSIFSILGAWFRNLFHAN